MVVSAFLIPTIFDAKAEIRMFENDQKITSNLAYLYIKYYYDK